MKNILIRHYIKTQTFTPLWAIPNALSFGELNILFNMLSSCSQKRILVKFFDFDNADSLRIRDIQIFSGYSEIIRRIRNVVNHYEPLIPFLINNIQEKKIDDSRVIKAIRSLIFIKSISKSHHFEETINFPEIEDTGYNTRKLRILQNIYNSLE